MADKKKYDDYLFDYAVKKGEGQQFEDDVKRGPPYTSRGFAIGHNEGGVERAAPYKKGSSTVPSFCKGGKVIRTWSR